VRFSENFNRFVETYPMKSITEEDLDDRKVVLDRLLKKSNLDIESKQKRGKREIICFILT